MERKKIYISLGSKLFFIIHICEPFDTWGSRMHVVLNLFLQQHILFVPNFLRFPQKNYMLTRVLWKEKNNVVKVWQIWVGKARGRAGMEVWDDSDKTSLWSSHVGWDEGVRLRGAHCCVLVCDVPKHSWMEKKKQTKLQMFKQNSSGQAEELGKGQNL